MENISARAKLYLLLFIMSGFIIGIGVYGVCQLHNMERNTKIIFFDELIALDELTTMRYSYTEGILNTVRAYRDHTISTDNVERLLIIEQKKIDSCWDAYRHTYLTPPEAELIRLTDPMIVHADSLIGLLRSGDMNVDHEADIQGLNGTIAELMPNLQSLIKLQVKVSDEFYRKNQNLFKTTSQNFALLVLLALILALGICIFIIRDISSLLLSLRERNDRLSESELKYRHLFNNTPMTMIIWDIGTMQMLELNKKAREEYGSPMDSRHVLESFAARQQEDIKALQGIVKEIVANKSSIYRKIWHHTYSDGEIRYMDINSHRIMYERRPSLLIIVDDVTAQYQADGKDPNVE